MREESSAQSPLSPWEHPDGPLCSLGLDEDLKTKNCFSRAAWVNSCHLQSCLGHFLSPPDLFGSFWGGVHTSLVPVVPPPALFGCSGAAAAPQCLCCGSTGDVRAPSSQLLPWLSLPAQRCHLLLSLPLLLEACPMYALPFPCGTVRSVFDILINFDLKTEAPEHIRNVFTDPN